MTERGLIVRGAVVPGTELVQRIPGVGWEWMREAHRPDLFRRPSQGIVDLSTWHWTAGPIREGEEAARRTFESMVARKREDGSDMSVSIHLVVGWDGQVWQLADLAVGTIHAGKAIDRRAVGIETTWPGSVTQARDIARALAARSRPVHHGYSGQGEARSARGHSLVCLPPSPELLRGVVALAELLSSLPASTGVIIPRQVACHDGGTVGPKSRGAHEHQHAPHGRKMDCCGYVTDALAAAGWAR